MFAGEYAADLDTQLQNFRAQFFRPLQLPFGIAVVQDQRVQVAVPCVKDIGDSKALGF